MSALVVVAVEEVWQSCGPVVVRFEDLPVGPLDLECAVEAFDLAVLPWTVRADAFVGGAQSIDRVGDSGGLV